MGFSIKVEQLDLMRALNSLKASVGKGKISPYEPYIKMKMETDSANRHLLTITTTSNGDMKEIRFHTLDGTDGVAPLIEFSKLYGIVSTIDATAEIDIVQKETVLELMYTGRREAIVFNGVDSELFPKEPVVNPLETLTLEYDVLASGLELFAPFISTNSVNPIFECMNVEIAPPLVKFSAIDYNSKRFVYAEKQTSSVTAGQFLIEVNALKKMMPGFAPSMDMNMTMTNSHIIVNQPHIQVSLRRMVGQFPDVTAYTHQVCPASVEVSKQELLLALERVKVFVDEQDYKARIVNVEFDNGFSVISLKSQLGNLSEFIMTKSNVTPFSMSFLIDGFYQAIKHIDCDIIKMEFYSKQSTILKPSTQSATYQDQRILVQSVKLD